MDKIAEELKKLREEGRQSAEEIRREVNHGRHTSDLQLERIQLEQTRLVDQINKLPQKNTGWW